MDLSGVFLMQTESQHDAHVWAAAQHWREHKLELSKVNRKITKTILREYMPAIMEAANIVRAPKPKQRKAKFLYALKVELGRSEGERQKFARLEVREYKPRDRRPGAIKGVAFNPNA